MSKKELTTRLLNILTTNCPSISPTTSFPSTLTTSTLSTYTKLLEDVFERRRLQKLDTGAESVLSAEEMTKRSAHRSGFKMPEKYEDDEKR
mmetsp:Transcript_22295/g.46344  ORF Transcript_22295/g.46344 Transcript_22295/m.46344 type:complete len:91 (-) Transcript_22295:55-327(-)